jgi:hypothetical protein
VARKAAARKTRKTPRPPKAAARRRPASSARASRPATPASARASRSAKPAAGVPRTIAAKSRVRRLAPGLERPRRTLEDLGAEAPVLSDADHYRFAAAARAGRAELAEHLRQHTETSPALTAGDVDADWASANHTGDEAPGGDNPTPDQDVVEEIGQALGIHYDDGEELKGADKISQRDQHRWELDPASSEDYRDRGKE